MDIRNDYPDFAAIEEQIRKARVERDLYVADLLAKAIQRIVRGTQRLFTDLGNGLQADWEKRAIEADSFLKRYVARY